MLVLSRQLNESILIGRGIEVRIMSIRGGKVRLGISAPRVTSILRKELATDAARREAIR